MRAAELRFGQKTEEFTGLIWGLVSRDKDGVLSLSRKGVFLLESNCSIRMSGDSLRRLRLFEPMLD